MPLQACRNDNPLYCTHCWEVGPARLASCNDLIIKAQFPGGHVQMQITGMGLGGEVSSESRWVSERKGKCEGNAPPAPLCLHSQLESTGSKNGFKRGEEVISRGHIM